MNNANETMIPPKAENVQATGVKAAAEKNSSSKRRKASASHNVAPKGNGPGPFEVRVDDAGTVMPSFWQFGG